MLKALNILIVIGILSGCTFVRETEKDGYPAQSYSVNHIEDAVPKIEPRTAAGNKNPYKVNGKKYYLEKHPEKYRKKGIASWYGTKFHGRNTANGEIYNMYGMTAAHKTLPIPSYVRVTNRDNGRSVIVRINDRGPFHDNRIIDLSYSAAKKLGYVNSGTAPVLVEYIDPRKHRKKKSSYHPASDEPLAPAPEFSGGGSLPENTYLQVGAFSTLTSAKQSKKDVKRYTRKSIRIVRARDRLYKVQVGPFRNNVDMQALRERLRLANFPPTHAVYSSED